MVGGEGAFGDRRADRRTAIQPVPVQRSRMRRGWGLEGWRRRCARWEVRASVSGLWRGLVVCWVGLMDWLQMEVPWD